MKLYAIATIVTASTVSFFQTAKSKKEANVPAPIVAASVETVPALDQGQSNQDWVILPPEYTELDLYQLETEAPFDDPLVADPEGGFSAGGVVKVVDPVPASDPVVDVVDPAAQVVDSLAEEPGKNWENVNEIQVAPVEAIIAEVEEGIAAGPEGAVAPEGDPVPADTASGDPIVVEADAVVVDLGDAPDASQLPTEGDMDPEIPDFPSTASSAEPEDTGLSGITDRLVDQVTEAVGGEVASDEAANEPTMGQEDGGFWLRSARLNDVFQYLARLADLQYFHNADLEASNYVVTGHLSDGDPLKQMEELGLMYGITIHQKGSTVYAMTPAQLSTLPTKPYYYQLKYLRPSDIEQIKGILIPLMTPGAGSVDYESKTNTLVFIDNETRIENVREILMQLDKPKQQIAIETRILRVKSGSRNQIGVDWESILGDGLTVTGTEALNTLFNLPDSDMVEQVITTTLGTSATGPFTVTDVNTAREMTNFGNVSGENTLDFTDETVRTINSTESQLVLDPLSLEATIRALNTGGLAQQESSPTLITEDNEAGIISIIDRVPIITATVSETSAGQNISEEVRYLVDENDPSFADDPAANREIGVTVAVTPTILPDGTIRMALRPRAAQVVELVPSPSGNFYPRVNESTIDTIARVPNGHSLLIGGFYEEQESDETKKVPVLGDVPGLNLMFKSTDTIKEHTSLVFVVTPKLYEPVRLHEVERVNREIHESHALPNDHAWPDRRSPGDNYEPNLGWTVGNALNVFPRTPPSSPLHPEHPVNMPEWDSDDNRGLQPGQTMVEPVVEGGGPAPVPQREGGLFGRLFKNRR